MPEHTCVVPVGYRCVFSIDEGEDGHWYRHLSVSVLGDGAAPNEYAVGMIMKELGFETQFPCTGKAPERLGMTLEDIGGEKQKKIAVGIIERLTT
jgi:hypothetical protein